MFVDPDVVRTGKAVSTACMLGTGEVVPEKPVTHQLTCAMGKKKKTPSALPSKTRSRFI